MCSSDECLTIQEEMYAYYSWELKGLKQIFVFVSLIKTYKYIRMFFVVGIRIFFSVLIRFRVQFGINLHGWVFPKAEIARAAEASAISTFWKTHKCKLISNWTRKYRIITYWRKCRKIFLEAIFTHSRNFCHRFMWYRGLRKIPIVFQQIIVQYCDA